MVSDETYELCLPVLLDSSLSADEDERTDRLEALLRSRTTLTGTALENAILDVLWRFREGGAGPATSPPPIRQTIMRRPSPAISNSGSSIGIAGGWRAAAGAQTPLSGSPRLGVSPLAPPGFGRPGGAGMGGSMGGTATPGSRGGGGAAVGASPFSSPRPSPRLAFASASAASQPMPILPHPSPGLHAYDFGTSSSFGAGPAGRLLDDSTATPMSAGPDGPAFYLTDDLAQQAETAVDWLVADNNNSSNNNDDVSVASSDRGGAAITAGVGSLSISSGGGGSSSGSTSVGVGGGGSSGGTSISGGGSSSSGSGLNAAVPEFVSQAQLGGQQASTVLPSFGTAGVAEMTPYDMLRSILGPGRTDEEIESALAMHGYDLSSTIVAMMDTAGVGDASVGGGFNGLGAGIGVPPGLQSAGVDDHAQQKAASLLVSRSMTPGERPTTPGSQKSGVICKFYLATGQCLRADCRFSHDLASHVCKYVVLCATGNLMMRGLVADCIAGTGPWASVSLATRASSRTTRSIWRLGWASRARARRHHARRTCPCRTIRRFRPCSRRPSTSKAAMPETQPWVSRLRRASSRSTRMSALQAVTARDRGLEVGTSSITAITAATVTRRSRRRRRRSTTRRPSRPLAPPHPPSKRAAVREARADRQARSTTVSEAATATATERRPPVQRRRRPRPARSPTL